MGLLVLVGSGRAVARQMVRGRNLRRHREK
jgi:hypothetical protein